jgi:hypothetical protein
MGFHDKRALIATVELAAMLKRTSKQDFLISLNVDLHTSRYFADRSMSRYSASWGPYGQYVDEILTRKLLFGACGQRLHRKRCNWLQFLHVEESN